MKVLDPLGVYTLGVYTRKDQREPELTARQGSEMEYHHENDHLSLACGPHRQRDTLSFLFCEEPLQRGKCSTESARRLRSLSPDWVQRKPLAFDTSRQVFRLRTGDLS